MEMLEIIKTRDNKKVIEAMIKPRRVSVWSGESHDEEPLNFNDALYIKYPKDDFRMPLIRVEAYLNTMLDIDDDFAQEVNEILYKLEKDDSDKVIEILKEKYGSDINTDGYLCFSGYTYNNPDNCYLDRDIVYHIFEYNGDEYVFVQVHYGADARVGFGPMVCFKANDIDYFFSGMEITAYDVVSDDDINMHDLDEIATYDIENDVWYRVDNGNEIRLHTSADGY